MMPSRTLFAFLLICVCCARTYGEVCGMQDCGAHEKCARVVVDAAVSETSRKIDQLEAALNQEELNEKRRFKKAMNSRMEKIYLAEQEETACEGNSLTISCPGNFVIEVVSGFYGRETRSVCHHNSIHNLQCRSTSAHNVISSLCNDKDTCTVSSSNSVFGDPCIGTYKYTQVKYRCRLVYAAVASACERDSLSISCPQSFVIQVLSGFYGRETNAICKNNNNNQNLQCRSAGARNVIKSLCNDKGTCTVSSSNSVFGDPCYGTYKYTQVKYRCRLPSSVVAYACEGDTLSISCPANFVIHVHSGFYGRKTNNVCYNKDVRNFQCRSAGAHNVVSSLCNDKQSCSVGSSNSVFGDPCYGTYKYTAVRYSCRPANDPETTVLAREHNERLRKLQESVSAQLESLHRDLSAARQGVPKCVPN